MLVPVISAGNYSYETPWSPDYYTRGNLQDLPGFTVDSQGNAHVASVGNSPIQTFSSSGTILESSAAIDWQKTLGGSNDEVIYGGGVTILPDGSFFIVSSYTQSSDGDVSGYHGGRDIWIAKLRSDRTIEWEKCLGGSGNETGNSYPTQLADGGYLISGTTTSNDGDVSGNHGGGDIWLVKISNNGTLEWQKCLGGSGLEEKPSIQMFARVPGGYIITATTRSNDGDVSGNHGGRDFWLMQFNITSRTIEWQRCLGGTRDEIGSYSNMLVWNGAETEFIIMGITESNDGDVSGNHGGSDLWFLKMFQNRTIAWQKCLGGSGNETGYDASPEFESTEDGGYLLSGFTESNNGDVSGNHGGGDTWIVKLNSNRGIEWQKCIGGSASDPKWFFNLITNDRIRVRGSTFSRDGDMTQSHGNKDFWIATLFANGTIESVTCLGGSGDESARSEYHQSSGSETIIFTSNSTDGDVTGNHGANDLWLVSLNPDTSINWSHCYGGSLDDWGAGLGIVWGAGQYPAQDGTFIFYGYTISNNGDVSGNHGNKDIWIVQSHLTPNTATSSQIGIFRPSTGYWYFDNNLDGTVDKSFRYGSSTDQIMKGNWTGTGTDGIAIFRPSTGYWYFDNNLDGTVDKSFRYGSSTDRIIAGDWQGTGRDGIAIFRPSTGYWYFDNNLDGTIDKSFRYGSSTDRIIAGDWQGTERDGIAIFRPATGYWYFDYNLDGTVEKSFRYGSSTDRITVGKWQGTQQDGIAIFRPSTGYWYFDYNLDGTVDKSFRYGSSTDQVIAGDWNSDGSDGIAIFRSSTGYWYFDNNLDGSVDKSFRYGSSTDRIIVGKWV
jgi:uncharacterized protein YneR